jgi:uncharacterized phage protein (predicted DNA packaging)
VGAMAIDLVTVKQFLHVDYNNEDEYLGLLILNADEYLRDCIDDYDTKLAIDRFVAKADLVKLMIVQDLFDNRDLTGSTAEKLRHSVQSTILQMQCTTYEQVTS